MSWQDSQDRFGLLSRGLHWLMAALLLWQLTGMVLKLSLGRHPLVATFVSVHQPIGMMLLLLAVLRLGWALRNRARRPKHGPGLLALAARAGQGALYALMLIVPVLGLIRANTRVMPAPGSARSGGATGTEASLAAPESASTDLLSLIGTLHAPLAWALLALILGHIFMALYHHLILRDGVTDSMFRRS